MSRKVVIIRASVLLEDRPYSKSGIQTMANTLKRLVEDALRDTGAVLEVTAHDIEDEYIGRL